MLSPADITRQKSTLDQGSTGAHRDESDTLWLDGRATGP